MYQQSIISNIVPVVTYLELQKIGHAAINMQQTCSNQHAAINLQQSACSQLQGRRPGAYDLLWRTCGVCIEFLLYSGH